MESNRVPFLSFATYGWNRFIRNGYSHGTFSISQSILLLDANFMGLKEWPYSQSRGRPTSKRTYNCGWKCSTVNLSTPAIGKVNICKIPCEVFLCWLENAKCTHGMILQPVLEYCVALLRQDARDIKRNNFIEAVSVLSGGSPYK